MAKNKLTVFFLNAYQESTSRGAEVFVSELAKRLARYHEVGVLGGRASQGAHWPFIWRFFLDPHGLTILWFTLKKLPAIVRARPDVVITVNGGWQPALVRLATWFYGGRLVISGQSGIGWDDRNNLWCFPDAFVALTGPAAQWAVKANPLVGKKVHTIPNGVDLELFQANGQEYKTQLKRPVILCVGALVASKGISHVIKAVEKLPHLSLLIVGEGPDRDVLQKMAQKLLPGRHKFASFNHTAMPAVYRAAELFTLPTWSSEAFGIVFLEAMACNVPVVARDDAIRCELVGDAGLFIGDPADSDSYANVLKEALNTNWDSKPRKQAQRYSWDAVAKKYTVLLRSIT